MSKKCYRIIRFKLIYEILPRRPHALFFFLHDLKMHILPLWVNTWGIQMNGGIQGKSTKIEATHIPMQEKNVNRFFSAECDHKKFKVKSFQILYERFTKCLHYFFRGLVYFSLQTYACLTSKLNSNTIPVLPSLDPILIFPFHLLPSPVPFPSVSSLASLTFLFCCHRTTTIYYFIFLFGWAMRGAKRLAYFLASQENIAKLI